MGNIILKTSSEILSASSTAAPLVDDFQGRPSRPGPDGMQRIERQNLVQRQLMINQDVGVGYTATLVHCIFGNVTAAKRLKFAAG